ncbi:glycosyltransferase [Aspergillus flavus]|nr:glycosyltransferase [Aspergillus flavus]
MQTIPPSSPFTSNHPHDADKINHNDNDDLCITALPEMATLGEVVDTILGQRVQLRRLQGSGAAGQSGCSIYFARPCDEDDNDTEDKTKRPIAVVKVYPPHRHSDLLDELASYKTLRSLPSPPRAVHPIGVGRTRDEESGALAGVVVYQVATGKAVNTILCELGWITRLRSLVRDAARDVTNRHKLQIFMEQNRGDIPVDWEAHKALEKQGVDIYFSEALPAFFEQRYQHLLRDLRSAMRAVASVLAKLHTGRRGEWCDAAENALENIRKRIRGWIEEIQTNAVPGYDNAGIGVDRREEMQDMVEYAIHQAKHRATTSLTHGDASSGNFFWDSNIGVTMIDYGGVRLSIDESGKPTGLAEMDTAGFYERLRKYAPSFGVSDDDVTSLQETFWTAYHEHNMSLDPDIVRLVRLRIQMSRLWTAVDKFNQSQDGNQAVVEGEFQRLRSIAELLRDQGARKRNILVVSNASGCGKGGIPFLNQELVNGLAGLNGVSVTLFLVGDNNSVSQTHHANVTVVGLPGSEANGELLYYMAKVHQPEEFGLPTHRDANCRSPFDLIIGHSRYSSAAAALVRDRFYPAAKLALITHTSPLRKADAAWAWYGGSRQQGYEEATRLAMLDERILPKADLAVGVGPVLTNEAREREWVGQLTRPRWSLTGPRFHELIPGAHIVKDDKDIRARRPDDPFKVLLAGRADDPAKGVDDAIHAVWKLAESGVENITIDILGVPIGEVEKRQEEVDQMTGIPALVRFHPFSNDQHVVRRSYQAADLVVMPSTHEGFGMIFTEVAGLGIPILVTEDSGAGQFALDRSRIPAELGDAVVVMDEKAYGIPASIKSSRVGLWADRINQVRQNPIQAVRNARELQNVMRGYSWAHAAEALLDAAMEHHEGDTVQTAHGSLLPYRPLLSPEVDASLRCATTIRNHNGVPEREQAAAVVKSLPEIAPSLNALNEFVSKALGHQVILRPLDGPHVKGFSGAPVFFAHSTFTHSYQTRQTDAAILSQGEELAVIKLFPAGLDNGIAEELSSLEWLLHQTKGDINTPTPIAVGRTTWDEKETGVVTYRVAQGVSLYQLMARLGLLDGPERDDSVTVLKRGVIEAAKTLAKLHSYAVQGRSSEGYLEWYYDAAPGRVNRLRSHAGILLEQTGIDVDKLDEKVHTLIAQSRQEIYRHPQAAVVHGDAHPGNFFFDPRSGRTTVIDVTTLHCSLDENGNPAGTPERDVGHFLHMLRRTGEQLNMREKEMDECSRAFLTAYNGTAAGKLGIHTLRLLGVCSALSFVGHALQGPSIDGQILKQQAKILDDMFCLDQSGLLG